MAVSIVEEYEMDDQYCDDRREILQWGRWNFMGFYIQMNESKDFLMPWQRSWGQSKNVYFGF